MGSPAPPKFFLVLAGFQPLDVEEEPKNYEIEKKRRGFADCTQPPGESWGFSESLNPVESFKSSCQQMKEGIGTKSHSITQSFNLCYQLASLSVDIIIMQGGYLFIFLHLRLLLQFTNI